VVSSKPQHKPQGQICTICGVPSRKHRVRNRSYRREYNHAHPKVNPSERIIGIDGEGQGRNPHRYFYLAAADEHGKLWTCEPSDKQRITTREALDFILNLPTRSLIVGYAFVYDLTQILRDLPDRKLYRLFHEQSRARPIRLKSGKWRLVYSPVWWAGYKLNYMNRRFSVGRKDGRRATVWDVFRFYAEKFTESLIKWGVAAKELLTRMAAMKEKRGQKSVWENLPRKVVQEYCDEECRYLAKLFRATIGAHEDAGLDLDGKYYGAGSTAGALLKKMDVLRFRGETPEAMKVPLACAFFGGRFENSCVGPCRGPDGGPVYNYDISSAYPYAATLLPCLECGVWEKVSGKSLDRRIRVSQLALLRWSIGVIEPSAWGVFPVRAKDGTITFPLAGEGGWTWKEEYLAARQLNRHIEVKEAWTYETDCDHRPNYLLPEMYRERCRIGKTGRGLVLKAGPNSVYGKYAQSKGLNPPFQSWVWAGNITSSCRAQLLDALRLVKDQWNILMLATDGVWSREKLSLPRPKDTGTYDVVDIEDGKVKPLGGWEETVYDRGVFAVRPGIYFPLEPTEKELKKVRARGLGRKVLYENWRIVVDAYHNGASEIEVQGQERFIGAISGTRCTDKKYKRSPDYGEWIPWSTKVTFNPAPKRRRILDPVDDIRRLEPWRAMPESVPYSNAIESTEAKLLREAEIHAQEQPDTDFTEQDFNDLRT
jgi:hypothetical protein